METQFLAKKVKRSYFDNKTKEYDLAFNDERFHFLGTCQSIDLAFNDERFHFLDTCQSIENKNTSILNKPSISQDDGESCPICFEQIAKIGITDCNHKFCFMCVYNWTLKTQSCPICRTKIISLNYFRRKTKLSMEIKKKKYESSCYICQSIKKIKPGLKLNTSERLVICECGMNFHLKCGKVSKNQINLLNDKIKCFDCMIFEEEMKSIDTIANLRSSNESLQNLELAI